MSPSNTKTTTTTTRYRRPCHHRVVVHHLCMMPTVLLLLLLVIADVTPSNGQFNDPPGERREQTFKVLEFENSNINQRYPEALRYYCTFRGKWSEERHPADFPRSPSWSAPVMISHSNGYRMWTGTEAVTAGVESIAEVRYVVYNIRVCTAILQSTTKGVSMIVHFVFVYISMDLFSSYTR